MAEWRFDQGRLDYFQFDEIKKIAKALVDLDGVNKPKDADPDTVRKVLSHYSELPFAPDSYYVWRNYGRVFGVLLLAVEIQGKIFSTDVCKQVAKDANGIDCDDYLAHFSRSFYYNSPVFQGYTAFGPQTFPAIAIVKFLISRFLTQGIDNISLDDVYGYLISNNVTGQEDLAFYQGLVYNPVPVGHDLRQVRELMKFISQFSFLTWHNPSLYLSVSSPEKLHAIESVLTPIINPRHAEAAREVLQMGSNFLGEAVGTITLNQVDNVDREFTEGRKIRVTHLRTERSSKLKSFYFATVTNPEICRMCAMDTALRYPWSEHVIELHHLLPLASPVRVESATTSLTDLVGICPSCHRATHKYYSLWFRENSLEDFRSYDEAHQVYQDAKNRIVCS